MEKKYTITLRLSYQQHAWLGALCRQSKQTQSEVIRSLIENGSVRERITQEHIHIIRQLIGESTNLNQLTRVRDKDCVKNRVKRAKIVRFTLC